MHCNKKTLPVCNTYLPILLHKNDPMLTLTPEFSTAYTVQSPGVLC